VSRGKTWPFGSYRWDQISSSPSGLVKGHQNSGPPRLHMPHTTTDHKFSIITTHVLSLNTCMARYKNLQWWGIWSRWNCRRNERPWRSTWSPPSPPAWSPAQTRSDHNQALYAPGEDLSQMIHHKSSIQMLFTMK